ncbi:MAG: LPS export ABC transporter periplasmic protein LptC, partial [Fimbriimonadales bacterium]
PTAEVVTREIKMQKYDTKGVLVWEVGADRAEGELSPDGDYTKVEGVTVIVHDDGKPAFIIDADRGEVSKSTGKLDLRGNVTAKSADDSTSLSCDRITYSVGDETLRATGNVTGESNGMSIGPAKQIDAKFRNVTKNMNASAATALVLTSLIAQGPGITYKDNAGNMSISGVDKFSMKPDASGTIYSFSGSGSPFIAKWHKQGIEVTARTVAGSFAVVQRGTSKSWELRSGKFTGNITATMDGERGNMKMSGLSVFNMELTEAKRWKFTGTGSPITVNLPDSGVVINGNTFEGYASGATAKPEWETAILTGGVKAVITQKDSDSGETYTVTATCPRVEINRANHFVRLSGGARAEGNHPAMGPGGATITSPVVILKFDELMKKVVEVELER